MCVVYCVAAKIEEDWPKCEPCLLRDIQKNSWVRETQFIPFRSLSSSLSSVSLACSIKLTFQDPFLHFFHVVWKCFKVVMVIRSLGVRNVYSFNYHTWLFLKKNNSPVHSAPSLWSLVVFNGMSVDVNLWDSRHIKIRAGLSMTLWSSFLVLSLIKLWKNWLLSPMKPKSRYYIIF